MTTNFTASNGVELNEWGVIVGYVTGDDAHAARIEFYRHLEDERLGRVRWPENPDYVVYQTSSREVSVFSETTAAWGQWSEGEARIDSDRDQLARAAAWYFENHPPREPWHDAKPGESWVVTWDERASACIVAKGKFSESGLVFKDGERFIDTFASDITEARRIWPEATDV